MCTLNRFFLSSVKYIKTTVLVYHICQQKPLDNRMIHNLFLLGYLFVFIGSFSQKTRNGGQESDFQSKPLSLVVGSNGDNQDKRRLARWAMRPWDRPRPWNRPKPWDAKDPWCSQKCRGGLDYLGPHYSVCCIHRKCQQYASNEEFCDIYREGKVLDQQKSKQNVLLQVFLLLCPQK